MFSGGKGVQFKYLQCGQLFLFLSNWHSLFTPRHLLIHRLYKIEEVLINMGTD